MSTLLGCAPVNKRRVFFSFHYQNDIFRANQVRQSWRYRHDETRKSEGFFDGSLWEKSKRTSDDSLKELIRSGIEGTSVTCVLVGSETYLRRWVRYEIARSIVKGNGLLTVKINNLSNQHRQTSLEGPNPLDFIGVYRDDRGNIRLAEIKNQAQWHEYSDYTYAVKLPVTWRQPTYNSVIELSSYAQSYCYIQDGGTENFAAWVRQAAANVGR
ncbi:MAG: TIR domain-containing protein [Pseudomonadota bacterium]